MKILFVIPHDTLLSPQGTKERLDGFLALLSGAEIHFLVPESTPRTDTARLNAPVYFFKEHRLFGRSIPYLSSWNGDFQRALRSIVLKEKIDVVIFEFPWGLASSFGDRTVPAVYFSAGVEREFSEVTLEQFHLNYLPFRFALRGVLGWFEGQACRRCSLLVAMSQRDAGEFQRLYRIGSEKIFVLDQPVNLDLPNYSKAECRNVFQLPTDRPIVVFHGSWAHLPNREAIERIEKEILPLISAELPDVLCIVAGPGVPKLSGKNIQSCGLVEDLHRFISAADAALVPISHGSGVRMKLFDYFRANVPVVSTAKAIEGIQMSSGVEAIICEDSAAALAEAIVKTLKDASLRQHLAAAARNFVLQHHNPKILSARLWERLNALSASSHP